jgi:hypothetical protein
MSFAIASETSLPCLARPTAAGPVFRFAVSAPIDNNIAAVAVNPDAPATRGTAAHVAWAFVAATLLMVLVLLVGGDGEHLHFLQKATEYTPAKTKVSFDGATTFLTNVQGALAPLVIPASVVGLIVGAGGVIFGQDWGKRTLNGALTGAVIVFLGPAILQ